VRVDDVVATLIDEPSDAFGAAEEPNVTSQKSTQAATGVKAFHIYLVSRGTEC
jgi:hypothetical protein